MTDRLALFLVFTILAALAVDFLRFDMQASLYLAKKSADLIEYMAFWR